MGKTLKTVLAGSMLAVAAASCNSSGCLDNGSAIPLAGFYSSATAKGISLDSLDITGLDAPGDSAIVRPGSGNSQVYLPMRPAAPATAWVIAYAYKALNNPALNDTIRFVYESIPYFASEECGAMFAYRVTSLTHTDHLIDSVTMTDPLVTNADLETIKIFFRVSEPSREATRR